MGNMFRLFIFLRNFRPSGKVMSDATNILMPATCTAENVSRPFFIRINDAPQMKPRNSRLAQFWYFSLRMIEFWYYI